METLKLNIVVTVHEEFGYVSLAEKVFAVIGPRGTLAAFGYNCGDVIQSLVHRSLAEADTELARCEAEDAEGEAATD